jgi:2-iminoacetate synthase
LKQMSFVSVFNRLPVAGLVERSVRTTAAEARESLDVSRPTLDHFARLISPAASQFLEELCQRSRKVTQQRFGKVIRLFAPLYLSNECINNCKYCGFSRDNPILRVTLSPDEVVREALALKEQGFRNLLLVAGEHPKFVSRAYLADCVRVLHSEFPSLSIEVGPMETEDYRSICAAGAEGLVVYQETYDRTVYESVHTSGPKRDFDWRLATAERGYAAGFRRLGVGALFGLSDWRFEAISVAAHAEYLLKHCWRAQLTISVPRLRPHAGEFQPLTRMSDRELAQLICALRLMFPDVALVLSTRERAQLRDGLIPIGITMMSAGSHTEPGGYTGAGKEKVHQTRRGRSRPLAAAASAWVPDTRQATSATGQFEISDERSAKEVAASIQRLGYEPVWKDWDAALSA